MSKDSPAQSVGAEEEQPGSATRSRLAPVRLDTSRLSSSYCNVVLANGSREEVVLSFGVNEDWERRESDVDVRFLHRVVLSPLGARRLHDRLSTVLGEHERRRSGPR